MKVPPDATALSFDVLSSQLIVSWKLQVEILSVTIYLHPESCLVNKKGFDE